MLVQVCVDECTMKQPNLDDYVSRFKYLLNPNQTFSTALSEHVIPGFKTKYSIISKTQSNY